MTIEKQKFLVKLLGFEYNIVYQPGEENRVVDALSRKEGSPLLWTVHESEEAKTNAPSGAEWRIWEEIRGTTRIDERSVEIKELLKAQEEGVIVRFKFQIGLIYYKDYVYIPDMPNLWKESLTTSIIVRNEATQGG